MPESRVLVAEDTLFVCLALEMDLRQNGFAVVGPATTVPQALALAETGAPDIAIIDIDLRGEMAFSVADRLISRGIPVILTTGFAPSWLPPRYAGVPILEKPYRGQDLIDLVVRELAATMPSPALC